MIKFVNFFFSLSLPQGMCIVVDQKKIIFCAFILFNNKWHIQANLPSQWLQYADLSLDVSWKSVMNLMSVFVSSQNDECCGLMGGGAM